LDQELQQIVPESEVGKRTVDKLVRVWRNDGEESWVLIHIEIQATRNHDFAERMYIYNNRIFDRYRRRVVSMAVLADRSVRWNPTQFAYQLWGCEVLLRFPTAKLLDWLPHIAELETSTSIFGVVTLTHLRALMTRENTHQRFDVKLQLARSLYQRDYTRQQIIDLLRFINWIITLPAEMNHQFWITHQAFEQENKMPYMMEFEKEAHQRGYKEGLAKAKELYAETGVHSLHAAIIDLLRTRFGSVPRVLRSRIKAIASPNELQSLLLTSVKVHSLQEFATYLP